jgi:Protein of unknown function (DUF4239)
MSAWIHSLPVGWMAVLVFGATYVAAAALYAVARVLQRTELGRKARAVSPGLLSPLGVTFGLLVVFTGAQVWGDVDRASAAVNREANALRTVVLLAAVFPDSSATRLRTLVARQIDEETTVEWPAMARDRETLRAIPAALAEALIVAAALEPSRPGQVAIQRELVAALTTALDARRLRILASHAKVNGLKWSGIILQALCTLALIALVHADNRPAAAAGMGAFATAVAICILLLLAHDEPFTGYYSVPPTPLLEVRPN